MSSVDTLNNQLSPLNDQEGAPVALFVTYTMTEPIVGGAFFRALRLAVELHRRGWAPVICNNGPELEDPKIEHARSSVRFVTLDPSPPSTWKTARKRFQSFRPDVVIMGEYPFPAMEEFFKAAQRQSCPLVVLDQFYSNWLVPPRDGIDLILLYGLQACWGDDFLLQPPYTLVPPFIEQIAPKPSLPIPAHLQDLPWVTFVAYDDRVLQEGAKTLSGLQAPPFVLLSVSPTPERAAQMLEGAGMAAQRTVTLPLVNDATLFGLIENSRVAILSNGFIQIMDSLALATPVIALARMDTPGQGELNIDSRFLPYVSLEEQAPVQQDKILAWLAASPFSPNLQAALQHERGGVSCCADWIEGLARNKETKALRRLKRWWARRFK